MLMIQLSRDPLADVRGHPHVPADTVPEHPVPVHHHPGPVVHGQGRAVPPHVLLHQATQAKVRFEVNVKSTVLVRTLTLLEGKVTNTKGPLRLLDLTI